MKSLKSALKAGLTMPGEVLESDVADGAAVIKCSEGSFEFSCPADGVMRIRTAKEGNFGPGHSWAVLDEGKTVSPAEIEDSDDSIAVSCGGLSAIVAKSSGALRVFDSDGQIIVRERQGIGVAWLDEGMTVNFSIEPRTKFFGFGEKTGPMDKTGKKMSMWNSDMVYSKNYDPLYISIPFTLLLRERRAAGLFFDNPARSRFDVGASNPGTFTYMVDEGELDLYVIEGPEVKKVVERYTALSGRIPLPPRWALGYHQCRWSYETDDEVRELVGQFRKRDIPLDCVHLDIHYLDRYRVFTFHPDRFPDPKKLADDVREKGVKLVAIIDPGVAKAEDYDVYGQAKEMGYLCRDSDGNEYNNRVWPGVVGFPDFSRSEVRKWWGDKHKVLTDAGIEGIWNDMNEPSIWKVDVRYKDYMLPLWPIRNPDMVHGEPGEEISHVRFRNAYGMMESRATFEGLSRLRPEKRPFVISRSGYAGIQRWAITWTGDNSSRFSHLSLSVRMLLNLGLSGVSIAGPDIGGFMWNCGPELYARWIALGVFYPFCRTHTAIRTRRQEPWSFGENVEKIAREFIKLRARLHPTLYSLVAEARETGAPVLRPLFFEFQEDHHSAEVEDQLMYGPSLLLAPVMEKGKADREVYLPPGVWTDFWTGEDHSGPKVIERSAPLGVLPAYVREGGILFYWPEMKWLGEKPVDRVTADIFPVSSGKSSAVLYEDDGESVDYTAGVFCKRTVSQERTEMGLRVVVSAKDGPFQPEPRDLELRIRLKNKPEKVILDGEVVSLDEAWDAVKDAVAVSFADDFLEHELIIEL